MMAIDSRCHRRKTVVTTKRARHSRSPEVIFKFLTENSKASPLFEPTFKTHKGGRHIKRVGGRTFKFIYMPL